MSIMTMLNRHHLEQLSKEQLVEIILEQYKLIQNQETRITALEKEIQAFKKDSSTSSKPPSTDQKPNRMQSLRQKTGKQNGGQNGHQGVTRMQVEHPDETVPCRPDACTDCGTDLSGISGSVVGKRQQADIPPVQITVTEYQQESVICPCCGKQSKGSFPDTVTAPFQIGLNLKSFVVYLNVAHHIPFERLTNILSDLLSIRISQGTVDNTLNDAYRVGTALSYEILNQIKQETWAGSDETGTRVQGQTWWKWTWQNLKGTYYAIEHSRGYQVVKQHFGEDYNGMLIHDCWSAQNNTHAQAHQLCHPHLVRDLNYCIETEQSAWAYRARQFLLASERARDRIWSDEFDVTLREQIIQSYYEQLHQLTTNDCTGTESRKIQKRMKKHYDKILTFLSDPDIPFHNNSSEQAIRNAKIHKKVSGGFRSERGARRHAVLLSIIETCKKRDMDILESLKLMFQGKLSFQGT